MNDNKATITIVIACILGFLALTAIYVEYQDRAYARDAKTKVVCIENGGLMMEDVCTWSKK